MKFRCKTAELLRAYELISIVTPREVTTKKEDKGFLFVVKGSTCYVYSRDATHVTKAEFEVFDVEDEGAFVYPAQAMGGFKFVGDELLFETRQDGDNQFFTRWESPNGAQSERSTLDPALVLSCDKDLEEATDAGVFPAAALREALAGAKDFFCKKNDNKPEHLKTVQVFDASDPKFAKANGVLFAATGNISYYFQCSAFEGQSLAVHGDHVPLINAFLNKVEGDVRVKRCKNMVFLTDPSGRDVLGWNQGHARHEKYSYYALKEDKFVMAISKAMLMNALQYMRTELPSGRDKISMVFKREDATLTFALAEPTSKAKTFPVPVTFKTTEAKELIAADRDFSTHINIDHFLSLISDLKGLEVELRVAFAASPDQRREIVMFRTIDSFRLDDAGKVATEGKYPCRVTRFAPSRE